MPADVARGDWPAALVHLVLAAGLAALLWRAWEHFLAARLVEPLEAGGAVSRTGSSGWVDRLYPDTPAGAVAARTLRYWRRDPRYLAGVAGLLIGPVVLTATSLLNPEGSAVVAVFAPCLFGLMLSSSIAQDLSYDGSALWTHVATGTRGADDRWGRVLSTLTLFVPVLVLLLAVAVALTRRLDLLAPVVGLTAVLLLAGLGVGCVVGGLWQWPAPPPGANPFQRGSSGGLPALLSFSVTALGTTVAALPTGAVVVWSFFQPWAGWLALPVGALSGALVLRLGVRWGGRLLERRWPEVMSAVSERS